MVLRAWSHTESMIPERDVQPGSGRELLANPTIQAKRFVRQGQPQALISAATHHSIHSLAHPGVVLPLANRKQPHLRVTRSSASEAAQPSFISYYRKRCRPLRPGERKLHLLLRSTVVKSRNDTRPGSVAVKLFREGGRVTHRAARCTRARAKMA